jgi:hypothetical protein
MPAWNNSGHVKSRLWEFHQSDKQSGCVYYYMGRGEKGLFQAGHRLVWDCLVHPLLWIWGWLANHTQQWWTTLWGWKPSYWRSSMPQKTGMFWTESWIGLSNRLVLAWEGQWLGWMIPSCVSQAK